LLNLAKSTNLFKDATTTNAVLLYWRKSSNIIRAIQRERVKVKVKGHSAITVSMSAISENDLPEKYCVTELGEQFLLMKDYVDDADPSKAILIFMSPNQGKIARKSRCWLADGTFKTCPAPFSRTNGSKGQIYTLFTELETGSVLPVGFAILPDKSSVSYARLWIEIHKALMHHGKTRLRLETIGMDFENAPKTQFHLVLLDFQMSGCFFTSGNAWCVN
jgi:hypothetical protein